MGVKCVDDGWGSYMCGWWVGQLHVWMMDAAVTCVDDGCSSYMFG